MKKRIFILKVVVIVAMALGLNGVVHALPCGIGFVDGGGADYECQDGTVGASNDWNTNLNDGLGFFGFTDWVKLDKEPSDAGDPAVVDLSVVTADNLSGTWAFGISPWGAYSHIMLVLKDGWLDLPPLDSREGDTTFSAYNVTFGDLSGNWDTGNTQAALSHMSVYGREGTPIPEPGTVMFFGAGIAGLFYVRRKKVFNI